MADRLKSFQNLSCCEMIQRHPINIKMIQLIEALYKKVIVFHYTCFE